MKAAVLFPGKQNHWVIAMPELKGSEQDREKAARVWFTINFPDTHEDVRITGMQIGQPEKIRGNFITKDFDAKFPADTTFIGLAFDYLGDEDVMQWPESSTGELWAILQGVPTIHLKTPIEEQIDIIGRTIDDISNDAEEAVEKAKEQANKALDVIPYVSVAVVALIAWNMFGRKR